MLAARYLAPGQIEAREIDVPRIAPGEALIRVEACGFCGSDLSIVAGTHPRARAPLTIGHELCGRVVAMAEDSSTIAVGDRVTSYPLISCGRCYACMHGNPHVCRQLRLFGFDLDGGMAEFVKLPVSSLLPLPPGMPPMLGALIEPLAVAIHGVERAHLDEVRVAAVLGAGPIGLLTALVAQHYEIPNVVISDMVPSRLDLARRLGLQAVAAGASMRDCIMEISGQNGADVVYECAGHPSSAKEMTDLVRSRGTVVNLGVFKAPVQVDMQAINFKEIELIGSRVYERKDFQTAIELAEKLPLEAIVSRQFPLAEVSEAFELFRGGDVCKVLMVPQGGSV